MLDFRASSAIIGRLVAVLGLAMLAPMAADLSAGDRNWIAFAEASFGCVFFGAAVAAASGRASIGALDIPQTFVLTTFCWLVLPMFGALPFALGAPQASLTDAFFEAMSGMTTTGSTVFAGLDAMPAGTLLWRGMLQWFGGLGIVVVAMAFLPAMRVGGMQFFRSEAFDTQGKVLPRAVEIATSLTWIYVGLTGACAFAYLAIGMSGFDATVHALTTISTGGFANYDASMGHFGPKVEYVAAFFMLSASLPFVRYVQMLRGEVRPLWDDSQVRAFAMVIGTAVAALVAYRLAAGAAGVERSAREALFNVISVITGTGYASVDYQAWGAFPMAVFFVIGLIGGCTGSTVCSVKIFRYQILAAALGAHLRRIHSPHGVFATRWGGRPVEEEVISSVMAFFFAFYLTLAIVAVGLGMLGHDAVTSLSGAATALANIGPGLGPIIGPAGNFAPLSDAAKWLLIAAMLLGRLELMAVFVLFTAAFWRR